MVHKVIIDTDPGVDDVLAILLSLASPEIDVTLLSIVFGNTHAPVAHANMLKIYHLLAQEVAEIPDAESRYHRLQGQDKTVLALGEDGPIGGDKAVAAYFHGPDGLSNISETHPHFNPPAPGTSHDHLEISTKPAHEAILDVLRAEPDDSVTIVALGPLTNLAHALRSDPTAFARVSRVVWMGGALDHPGNTSPVAEFNCFADPYAADQILSAVKAGAIELVMAPLDITTPHQVPFSDLIHPSVLPIPDKSGVVPTLPEPTPLQSFVSAMLVRVRGLQASFGLPDAMEMHDPVAVWYAIAGAAQRRGSAPPAGWGSKQREFSIERSGELTRGMCVVDRRGTGEVGVDRSADEQMKSFGLDSNASNGEGNGNKGQKDDNTGRMGEKIDKPLALPWIITKTPGSETLRKLLLERVFGTTI